MVRELHRDRVACGDDIFRLGAVTAKKLPVVPVSAKAVVGVKVVVGGLNALFT